MKKRVLGLMLILVMIVMALPVDEFISAAEPALNKTSVEITIGETVKLKLKGAAGTVKWSSSKEKVAKVSSSGKVTAVGVGKTVITAKFGGKKYKCTVVVPKIDPELSNKKYKLGEGGQFTLKLKGAITKSYKSSNTNVVKVSKKGIVTAVSVGTAKIRVTDTNGNKYYCKVEVVYDAANHVHTVGYHSSKDPSCTETGLTTGEYCTVCGEIFKAQEVIPAKGHSFKDGKCTVCGETDPNYTAPCEHVYKSESKAATCTEAGYTEKVYCEICGQIFLQPKEIKPLGHDYQNGFCTRCGEKEVHEYVTVKGVAATCTEAGRTDYIYCKICGDVMQYAEDIAPLGHEYNGGDSCIRCGADKWGHVHKWVIQKYVPPTCTEVGYTEGKYCETCGYIEYAQQFIPPLHHNFKDGKCTRCGAKED